MTASIKECWHFTFNENMGGYYSLTCLGIFVRAGGDSLLHAPYSAREWGYRSSHARSRLKKGESSELSSCMQYFPDFLKQYEINLELLMIDFLSSLGIIDPTTIDESAFGFNADYISQSARKPRKDDKAKSQRNKQR